MSHDFASMDLDALAEHFGTDKCSRPVGKLSPKGYTIPYAQFLDPRREEPITLLEIGVYKGASLKMWEAYLPKARIIGIDIKDKCKQFETDRTKIFIGDQADSAFLESVVEAAGGSFDAIIDDGGHRAHQHKVSLQTLFPRMNPSGFYAIEDLHTAYHRGLLGFLGTRGMATDLLRQLIDEVNDAPNKPGYSWAKQLESLHFFTSLAILKVR